MFDGKQEKIEKRIFDTKIAYILEENKTLKEELSKVKDEISYIAYKPNSAANSSKFV